MLRHWWNQTDLRAKQFFFPRSFFLSLLNLAPLPLCRGSLWPTAETFRPSTTSTNFEALNYTASKGPIINPCGGGNTQGWDVAQALLCVPTDGYRTAERAAGHSIGTAGLGRDLWTSSSPTPKHNILAVELSWSLFNKAFTVGSSTLISKQCTGLLLIVCGLNEI